MIFSTTFVLVAIVGTIGALSSIIKKNVLYVLQPVEFLTITFFLEFIFMGLFLLLSGKIKNLQQIKKKITRKEGLSMVGFSFLIAVLAFCATLLAKREDISKIAPILAIVDTVLTFLGGVYILKEGAKAKDFIAIILMVLAISLLSSN